MASVTAAFWGTSILGYNKLVPPPPPTARRFVAAKASVRSPEREMNKDDGSIRGRRELMLAAAAVAAWSVGDMAALAEDAEPKPGTPEAKKKYAPVCVTMPTARICHK